jgi:hypothetical protein
MSGIDIGGLLEYLSDLIGGVRAEGDEAAVVSSGASSVR